MEGHFHGAVDVARVGVNNDKLSSVVLLAKLDFCRKGTARP